MYIVISLSLAIVSFIIGNKLGKLSHHRAFEFIISHALNDVCMKYGESPEKWIRNTVERVRSK